MGSTTAVYEALRNKFTNISELVSEVGAKTDVKNCGWEQELYTNGEPVKECRADDYRECEVDHLYEVVYGCGAVLDGTCWCRKIGKGCCLATDQHIIEKSCPEAVQVMLKSMGETEATSTETMGNVQHAMMDEVKRTTEDDVRRTSAKDDVPRTTTMGEQLKSQLQRLRGELAETSLDAMRKVLLCVPAAYRETRRMAVERLMRRFAAKHTTPTATNTKELVQRSVPTPRFPLTRSLSESESELVPPDGPE